jgi:hypothetical protein
MKVTLWCIRETEKARLYRRTHGADVWVPRSVCRNVLKWPPEHGNPPIHEVEIEDWFLKKNPALGVQP